MVIETLLLTTNWEVPLTNRVIGQPQYLPTRWQNLKCTFNKSSSTSPGTFIFLGFYDRILILQIFIMSESIEFTQKLCIKYYVF